MYCNCEKDNRRPHCKGWWAITRKKEVRLLQGMPGQRYSFNATWKAMQGGGGGGGRGEEGRGKEEVGGWKLTRLVSTFNLFQLLTFNLDTAHFNAIVTSLKIQYSSQTTRSSISKFSISPGFTRGKNRICNMRRDEVQWGVPTRHGEAHRVIISFPCSLL